ncbi:MAG TPA: hypothetical protein VIW03_16490 [Anaeromyxobacter sp.]
MQKTAAALALALAASAVRAQVPGAPVGGKVPVMPPPGTSGPASPGAPAPAAPAGARAEPPPSKAPVPRGAVLEEVSGVVREVDHKDNKLTVEAVTGPITLSLDRNTMVYTASGLGTVLDLAAGQQVRAGRNADFRAYWVQLRAVPAKAEPVPVPGQGTGPAGSSAAPAGESTGKGAGPAPAPPAVPGGAPPGPSPAGTPPGQ